MAATILLVDDHALFRQGLRLILEREKDLKVVGEAGDGQEAIDRFRDLSPDVVVMDISMPNVDGVEATRRIVSEFPQTKVVALSVHSGKRFVSEMLQAGVAGYILKETVPEELIQGLWTVLAGKVYLSASISGVVVSEYKKLLPGDHHLVGIQPQPILLTKLHRPPITADIIPRARLIEVLENGIHQAMTLFAAPAGYGKSILTSQWLEVSKFPGGWVSLDENDNEPRVLLTYLLAAIKRIFPETPLQTISLLQAANLPPAKELAHNLLNDLDGVAEPFILVLDDYHRISSKAPVHDLLAELLRHPTPRLHLVLLTRRDPPLPMGSVRARGLLNELTTEDLRFTHEETKTFLERLLKVSIDEDTVAILDAKIEGWVAGLRLASLSLGRETDRDRFLRGFKESIRYITDYLVQEVLSGLSPARAQYLMATSILDRFCAPLCEVFRLLRGEQEQGEDDLSGRAFIEWLEKSHMFLIPLDAENRWFRFHHLFQTLLLNQLKRHYSSEEINGLHARASAWFADNGLITEAIRHALAAGDETVAAQLVVQNRQAALNAERWFVLEKWLSMLPDAIIQQRPELLIAQVWIHYYHFNYGFIPSMLDAAESLLSHQPEEHPLYGEIYLFRAVFYLFQGNAALSVKYVEDALERIPETEQFMRGTADTFFGVAGQMHGQKERVVNILTDLLHNQPLGDVRKVRVIFPLVLVHMISGDLSVAFTLNQQLKTLAISITSTHYIVWSSYLSGLIHYCRNELDLAIDHLSQAAELIYAILRRVSVDCLAALALTYQAAQQTDRAGATLDRLIEYAHSLSDPTSLNIANSCRTRLSLMQGEAVFSPGLADIDKAMDEEPMFFYREIPAITHCKVLLEEGSDAGLQEAENRLQECLRLCRTQHNTFQMIFILPLLALAYEKQGRPDEAVTVLEEAVNLAGPGGFIRPFVEPGPELASPLKRLAEKNIAVAYIRQILAAFSPPAHPPSSIAQTSDGLLTRREQDILELLAQRLQSKEIAEKLFISPETVRSHLKNIYQKLQVNNRRQAVAKSIDLGILSHR
jgi:LuxR family maltose regulon positive regulatory protein